MDINPMRPGPIIISSWRTNLSHNRRRHFSARDGSREMFKRLLTVKNLIRVALTAFSLANMGVAHAAFTSHAPTTAYVAASAVR
jgi:hypothetical protein